MQDTKLDRAQIVDMALQIMQSDGINGLSMRKLAAKLNIRAPTLYWYFPDRSSILREAIKTLFRDTIGRIPKSDDWRTWLQAFGEELWQTNRKSPFVTMLMQSSEWHDQETFKLAIDLLDQQVATFQIDRLDFLRIHSDIQALVLGWGVFLQAGVVNRIEQFFDADQAVIQGVEGIINAWNARMNAKHDD